MDVFLSKILYLFYALYVLLLPVNIVHFSSFEWRPAWLFPTNLSKQAACHAPIFRFFIPAMAVVTGLYVWRFASESIDFSQFWALFLKENRVIAYGFLSLSIQDTVPFFAVFIRLSFLLLLLSLPFFYLVKFRVRKVFLEFSPRFIFALFIPISLGLLFLAIGKEVFFPESLTPPSILVDIFAIFLSCTLLSAESIVLFSLMVAFYFGICSKLTRMQGDGGIRALLKEIKPYLGINMLFASHNFISHRYYSFYDLKMQSHGWKRLFFYWEYFICGLFNANPLYMMKIKTPALIHCALHFIFTNPRYSNRGTPVIVPSCFPTFSDFQAEALYCLLQEDISAEKPSWILPFYTTGIICMCLLPFYYIVYFLLSSFAPLNSSAYMLSLLPFFFLFLNSLHIYFSWVHGKNLLAHHKEEEICAYLFQQLLVEENKALETPTKYGEFKPCLGDISHFPSIYVTEFRNFVENYNPEIYKKFRILHPQKSPEVVGVRSISGNPIYVLDFSIGEQTP